MFTYAFLHNVWMNWKKEMYLTNSWAKPSFEGVEFLRGRMLIIECYCKCYAEESDKAGRKVPLLIVLVLLVLSHPTQVHLKQKMGEIVELLWKSQQVLCSWHQALLQEFLVATKLKVSGLDNPRAHDRGYAWFLHDQDRARWCCGVGQDPLSLSASVSWPLGIWLQWGRECKT